MRISGPEHVSSTGTHTLTNFFEAAFSKMNKILYYPNASCYHIKAVSFLFDPWSARTAASKAL